MNFIFIMSDSFRFDNLGCYTKNNGRLKLPTPNGPVKTPNLDGFAQSATIFDKAYAGSFPTIPNRKDILKGMMRPYNIWGALEPEENTFIAELGKAGYTTQLINDTPHLMKNGTNFDRDFDAWDWVRGQEVDRLSCIQFEIDGDPKKNRRHPKVKQINYGQHSANMAIFRYYEQDWCCAQTMTRAAEWLERNYKRIDKFCLYLDTFDPHEPFDAPKWYEDMYNPDYKGHAYRYPVYGRANLYTAAEQRHIRAMYAAEVSLVDRWIGHLLDSVERMGLLDTTCIIFASDHGYASGDHGWIGKNVVPLYEEIVHIPLLIRLPGQTKTYRVKSIVQPYDIAATILDLAGVKKPKEMNGISLKAALKKKPLKTQPYAFTCGANMLAITSRDWSLQFPWIRNVKRSRAKPELFHLPSDPNQTKNVLHKNLAQARKMWEAHEAFLAEAGVAEEDEELHPPRP